MILTVRFKMEYPFYDYVWCAKSCDGQLVAFTTGGQGPIPLSVMNLINIESLEEAILRLPRVSTATVHASYPKMDSFINIAERGVFVFDWVDVHRTQEGRLQAYELIASPSKSISELGGFEIPEITDLKLPVDSVPVEVLGEVLAP